MAKKHSTQTQKKKKTAATSKKSLSAWDKYCRERDAFYISHPMIRPLLGVLIVSFAVAIGLLYYNKTVVYIGLSLDEYGIRYPYVDTSPTLKSHR
jgi:hypothetical protein